MSLRNSRSCFPSVASSVDALQVQKIFFGEASVLLSRYPFTTTIQRWKIRRGFCISSYRVIIEIDGVTHSTPAERAYDAKDRDG